MISPGLSYPYEPIEIPMLKTEQAITVDNLRRNKDLLLILHYSSYKRKVSCPMLELTGELSTGEIKDWLIPLRLNELFGAA
jgi:hypothetical protein